MTTTPTTPVILNNNVRRPVIDGESQQLKTPEFSGKRGFY